MFFSCHWGWSIATGNIPSLKGRGAFLGGPPFLASVQLRSAWCKATFAQQKNQPFQDLIPSASFCCHPSRSSSVFCGIGEEYHKSHGQIWTIDTLVTKQNWDNKIPFSSSTPYALKGGPTCVILAALSTTSCNSRGKPVTGTRSPQPVGDVINLRLHLYLSKWHEMKLLIVASFQTFAIWARMYTYILSTYYIYITYIKCPWFFPLTNPVAKMFFKPMVSHSSLPLRLGFPTPHSPSDASTLMCSTRSSRAIRLVRQLA